MKDGARFQLKSVTPSKTQSPNPNRKPQTATKGFVPTENLRFRDESLTFKVTDTGVAEEDVKKFCSYEYPAMVKTQGNFTMSVEAGSFTDSEIIVMLGENGTGKTTFIRMLAGACALRACWLLVIWFAVGLAAVCRLVCAARLLGRRSLGLLRFRPLQHPTNIPEPLPNSQTGMLPPDTCDGDADLPQFNVSYKPQKISPKFEGTVRQLLHKKIRESYLHPQFVSDVMRPLTIDPLMDQEVQHLSGGELQV
jgi:ATP-binding cassette subfamily E protein 1